MFVPKISVIFKASFSGEVIAKRICMRTGLRVFCSCNINSTLPLLALPLLLSLHLSANIPFLLESAEAEVPAVLKQVGVM
jgi:hypothetical protein